MSLLWRYRVLTSGGRFLVPKLLFRLIYPDEFVAFPAASTGFVALLVVCVESASPIAVPRVFMSCGVNAGEVLAPGLPGPGDWGTVVEVALGFTGMTKGWVLISSKHSGLNDCLLFGAPIGMPGWK